MRKRRTQSTKAILGVQMDLALKTQIEAAAEAQEMLTSQLVRSILRGWLRSYEQQEREGAERERQAAAAQRRAQQTSVWPISKPVAAAGGR